MTPNTEEKTEVEMGRKDQCAQELDAVLKKYNCALVPTFNLYEIPDKEEEEVTEEEGDE